VKARIEAAIERKVEGKEIEVAPTLAEPAGQVIDLMEALRASVQQKTVARRAPAKAAPAEAPAPAQAKAAADRKPPRKVVPETQTRRRAAKG